MFCWIRFVSTRLFPKIHLKEKTARTHCVSDQRVGLFWITIISHLHILWDKHQVLAFLSGFRNVAIMKSMAQRTSNFPSYATFPVQMLSNNNMCFWAIIELPRNEKKAIFHFFCLCWNTQFWNVSVTGASPVLVTTTPATPIQQSISFSRKSYQAFCVRL